MSIIRSPLDLDYYKLTMAQVVLLKHPSVWVKYGLNNRTVSVPIAEFVDEQELRAELEHIRTLRFTPDEIEFLRESAHIPKGLFCEEFLAFLEGLQLPEVSIERLQNGQYRVETEGRWPDTILWETLILSTVNELYFLSMLEKEGGQSRVSAMHTGFSRLAEKILRLKENPGIHFTDFGTRRRFSREWQQIVVHALLKNVPNQLMGTSNVFLARKFGIPPMGTYAHEMDMVYAGIYHESDEAIRASHQKVLLDWWEVYGESLSIALTDTYGSDFFFADMTHEQAAKWRGLRQDSGDPFAFGEEAIAFYLGKGIDPCTKLIVFSDGLDIKTITALYTRFRDFIRVVFGWGTNLTNDVGFEPLSLVLKAIMANGKRLGKISDNLAKATGIPEDIEQLIRIFGYTGNTFEQPRY